MVKTNVKFTNVEATPDIKAYLDKRLSKISRFADKEQDEVILRVEVGKTTEHHRLGDVFRAEIQAYFRGGDLRAESQQEDLFAAIDIARDEFLREMKRVKGKEEAQTRRGGRLLKNVLRRFYR